MTQKIGVIGYPLKHSLSPVLQQAALDYCKLDIRYELWETEAGKLPSVIDNLRLDGYMGANITIPYKESVMYLLDMLDEQSSLLGAVNTIVNTNGKLVGYNTDAEGFIKALYDDAGFAPADTNVLILGAGGAGRAISFALVQQNVRSITIMNRTVLHAEKITLALTQYLKAKRSNIKLSVLPWQSPEFPEVARNCQLIVNCTSFGTRYSPLEGQSPVELQVLQPGSMVFDLVYNPVETPLLVMAKKAGARTLGGLPMLVYQGAAAFSLWTGIDAPIDVMRSAATRVLESL